MTGLHLIFKIWKKIFYYDEIEKQSLEEYVNSLHKENLPGQKTLSMSFILFFDAV